MEDTPTYNPGPDRSRKIDYGTSNYTEVFSCDDKGPGGAHYIYVVKTVPKDPHGLRQTLSVIHFQNGAIKETGVNGVHNEDLLVMVLDRLECYQDGPYECPENDAAAYHIRKALSALRDRTNERKKRGVEGTHVV